MENPGIRQQAKCTQKKARGVSLLSAIYDELSDCIEDADFNSEELLNSAQKLIDLSKKDFILDTYSEPRRRDGYYSHDVCTAFDKYQGRILENEFNDNQDQLLTVVSQCRVRELMGGSRSDMNWGSYHV